MAIVAMLSERTDTVTALLPSWIGGKLMPLKEQIQRGRQCTGSWPKAFSYSMRVLQMERSHGPSVVCWSGDVKVLLDMALCLVGLRKPQNGGAASFSENGCGVRPSSHRKAALSIHERFPCQRQ